MLQRVGIAQALINDPELVFLDEPMSGLDPLGRRDVRALILRLRDRGCTVFFSSHVLSDAEALCSRVAILARAPGRDRPADRHARVRRSRGWELVVAGVSADARSSARIAPACAHARLAIDGRYASSCRSIARPDALLSPSLPAAGAALVSLNPLRDTLEDFFVRAGARERRATAARRRSAAS